MRKEHTPGHTTLQKPTNIAPTMAPAAINSEDVVPDPTVNALKEPAPLLKDVPVLEEELEVEEEDTLDSELAPLVVEPDGVCVIPNPELDDVSVRVVPPDVVTPLTLTVGDVTGAVDVDDTEEELKAAAMENSLLVVAKTWLISEMFTNSSE